MRKAILLLCMALSIVWTGCKTKKTDCEFHYQHMGCTIALGGFNQFALDTLFVTQYKPDGSFDSLIRTDIIVPVQYTALHDTLFIENAIYSAGYEGLKENFDYELNVDRSIFRITGISGYPPDYSYTTYKTCPHGNYGLAGPSTAHINGVATAPFNYNPTHVPWFPNLCILLRK